MRAMAVVPTYNEALNIASLLREILKQGPDIGAVVVDDNSPDGTAGIVEQLRREDPRVHLILRLEERKAGESTFNRKIMLNALKMMIKIRWQYRNYPPKNLD